MEYKDYIEKAKKYLNNDDSLASYREYYAKAVNSLDSRHDKAKADINDEYAFDVGRAVTQSRMNSKNIDQYMASRGLARSGEAEQERINENLSLNSSLGELAKEKNKNLREADAEHSSSLLALEKELAEKEYDAKLKNDENAASYADRQLAMDQRNEDIALDKEKTASEHAYNEYMKRLEAELEESAAAKTREYEKQKIADERAYNEKLTADERAYKDRLIADERAYEKSKIEDERAYAERQKAAKEAEENGRYTPKQSAESLAKEVVKNYTWSGEKVSSKNDRIKIYDFLEEFRKSSNATDEYINELESALRSMGYKELNEAEETARSVVKSARDKYDEWYYEEINRYDGTELSPLDRSEKAKEAVLFRQLDYCWLHTSSEEEFESCFEMMNVSESVRKAYSSRPFVTDPETGKTTFKVPKGE